MTTADQREAPGQADDGVLEQQRMADGQLLRLRSWPAASAARSEPAVLLVHGLGEHSGRYRHVASWFRARGYDVRSYDQRGHGLTPGRRGALRRDDDLLSDLAEVYIAYAAGRSQPPLLLGHSMGGLVALRTVLDGRITPSALLLSSPALRSWEAPWLRKLARVLAATLPSLPLRTGLSVDYLSHDLAVVAAYRNDRLCAGTITPRLADFIFRAGAACITDAARLNVPSLLLVASADKLVDPSGSSDFAKAANATGQLTARHFAALYHELMNEAEPGRSQVMKQLGDWLARLPA